MKLDRGIILSGLLASLVPSGMAQDLLPIPEDVPPPLELELIPPIQEDEVINRVNPGSGSNSLRLPKSTAPRQLIAEGGGTRLLNYCKRNPVSSARSFFHHLVAETADGRQFLVYHDESRSPEPVARVNDRGDVVTVLRWSCVGAFFAPDYKPVKIRKLRSDRFLKAAPKFEHFTIRDIAWGDGMLVCSGHLSISGGEYPFLSRLLFSETGEVSDHQILWTTWKPGPSSSRNPAANSIARSLHQQGNLVLWKNTGQNQKSGSQDFQQSCWRCTELATGITRPLAEADPVNRDRLAQIEQEIAKAQTSRKPRP